MTLCDIGPEILGAEIFKCQVRLVKLFQVKVLVCARSPCGEKIAHYHQYIHFIALALRAGEFFHFPGQFFHGLCCVCATGSLDADKIRLFSTTFTFAVIC